MCCKPTASNDANDTNAHVTEICECQLDHTAFMATNLAQCEDGSAMALNKPAS